MKRFIWLVVFMLIMAMCTVAAADTLFQSYRFQFNLPDGWLYTEASDSHIQCKRTDDEGWTETIDVFEPRFGSWPESIEDIPRYIRRGFDFDQDADIEWIEIAGQETAILDAPGYQDRDAFMTVLHGKRNLAFVLYSADKGHRDKEGFITSFNTFAERENDDLGFFSIGDADVKFDYYRKKEIGGKERLVIGFVWRNKSDSIGTFDSNIEVIVFQNGIELNESLLVGNTDSNTRIMAGKELDCLKIFDLREPDGEVYVIVDRLSDTNNEFAERTYTLNIR